MKGKMFLLLARQGAREWREFGVVAIQRRQGGLIWLVIIELKGPTTCASAKAIRYVIDTGAPSRKHNKHSEILWGVKSTDIKMNYGISEDKRKIIREQPRLIYIWSAKLLVG